MSYADTESRAVAAIKNAIPASLKRDMLKESSGMFAELYETTAIPDHYVATAIDSVGSKVLIAEALGKYDTVGIDCVAMSANDLATLGAVSPFLFMDCLSCQSKIEEEGIAGEIVKGIAKGLEQCDASGILKNSIRVNFGKGETASVTELLSSTKPGYGFDLVGCMIGLIEKQKARQSVQDGDVIIALPSSGPHSNGFTALRHHLLNGDFETRKEYKQNYKGKHSLDDLYDGSAIGRLLLEPTRIYVREMAAIARDFDVVGINNTGYGLKNFNRIPGSFEFRITNPLDPQPLSSLMQGESGFSDREMYESFNMGMGFFIIARKEDAGAALQKLKDAAIVGSVAKSASSKTVLEKGRTKLVFEGY
jgi:phosphoribosylformylglycinamidine cyclo-ligase